jgi:O-antigen/teichoic acid export membrane protein
VSEQGIRQGNITRRGAAGVGLASVVSAVSGYMILVVTARALGPERNADFLVFWALMFGLFGILGGLQQETTRSVRSSDLSASASERHVRVLPTSVLVGAGAAVLVGASSFLWGDATFGSGSWPVIVALCLAAPAFAGDSALVGALAGRGSWRTYSAVVSSEAIARLLFVLLVVLVGATTHALEIASAAASVVWVVYSLVAPAGRRAARATGDGDTRQFLISSGHAMVAAASSAALVVGFPVILRLSSSAVEWVTAAPLLLAVSLTRAPLLMPLNAYQGVAIAHFTSERERGMALLLRPAAAIAGVGALGAVGAYLLGPFIMVAFFGQGYYVGGLLLAALTLGAACLALLTLTGSAVLAAGRHKAYALGWFVSCLLCVALLLTPLPLASRSVLSLCVGPLAGIAWHLLALRSPTPATSVTGEGPEEPRLGQ